MADSKVCDNEWTPSIICTKGSYNLDQSSSLSSSHNNAMSEILKNSSLNTEQQYELEQEENSKQGNYEGSSAVVNTEVNMFSPKEFIGNEFNCVNELGFNETLKSGKKVTSAQQNSVSVVTMENELIPIIETSKTARNKDSNIRMDSQSDKKFCRICFSDEDDKFLISPCRCIGSSRFVHRKCLETWLKASSKVECEICKFVFSVKLQTTTFLKWKLSCLTEWEKLAFAILLWWFLVSIAFCAVSTNLLDKSINYSSLKASTKHPIILVLMFVSVGVSDASLIFSVMKLVRYFLDIRSKLKKYNRTYVLQNAPIDR